MFLPEVTECLCWESACLECAASRAIGRAASAGASSIRCFFACTALVGAAGRAASLLRFTPFPGLRLGAKPATQLCLNSPHDVLPLAVTTVSVKEAYTAKTRFVQQSQACTFT